MPAFKYLKDCQTEEVVELLSPQGVEIGHVLENQLKLAREYELPHVRVFQQWGEPSTWNSRLAHTWGLSKEQLDEQRKGTCLRWEGLDYGTHRRLSNPGNSTILCSKQRGKRESSVMSAWSQGWSVFQLGSCGHVHVPHIICSLCIWPALILSLVIAWPLPKPWIITSCQE